MNQQSTIISSVSATVSVTTGGSALEEATQNHSARAATSVSNKNLEIELSSPSFNLGKEMISSQIASDEELEVTRPVSSFSPQPSDPLKASIQDPICSCPPPCARGAVRTMFEALTNDVGDRATKRNDESQPLLSDEPELIQEFKKQKMHQDSTGMATNDSTQPLTSLPSFRTSPGIVSPPVDGNVVSHGFLLPEVGVPYSPPISLTGTCSKSPSGLQSAKPLSATATGKRLRENDTEPRLKIANVSVPSGLCLREQQTQLSSIPVASVPETLRSAARHSNTNGRWTEEEHEIFLAALAKYGREWKKVATHIPSRTSSQVRSHAQKYFAKLQKSDPAGEKGTGDEEIISVSAGKASVALTPPMLSTSSSRLFAPSDATTEDAVSLLSSLAKRTLTSPLVPCNTEAAVSHRPNRTTDVSADTASTSNRIIQETRPHADTFTPDLGSNLLLMPSTFHVNVARILSHPEAVQAEVEATLRKLYERYQYLQERLRRRQQRREKRRQQQVQRDGNANANFKALQVGHSPKRTLRPVPFSTKVRVLDSNPQHISRSDDGACDALSVGSWSSHYSQEEMIALAVLQDTLPNQGVDVLNSGSRLPENAAGTLGQRSSSFDSLLSYASSAASVDSTSGSDNIDAASADAGSTPDPSTETEFATLEKPSKH
jgi:SHAQKYF class myb-like DNA-binding protein